MLVELVSVPAKIVDEVLSVPLTPVANVDSTVPVIVVVVVDAKVSDDVSVPLLIVVVAVDELLSVPVKLVADVDSTV